MAELHSALKALGPEDWAAVPTSDAELDQYLADLFSQCQTVLDSVPSPPVENVPTSIQHHARKATEVSLSAERSDPPSSEHEKLQKEWGKAMKLKPSENPLGMSVYKLSGKDGKGAWFARRSVHEGVGFNRFKKSLEMEFPESMAEPGPPGTGNIRGIGGEEKVADIKIQNRGRVEVYRLSAQFPGPTTPRDFVTLLVTSSKAMGEDSHKSEGGLIPRHYMILSKPCNHPETQPRTGFIRGSYESVEFIREVPRKLKTSQSSVELNKLAQHKGSSSLQKDVLLQNAGKAQTFHSPSGDLPVADRPYSSPEEAHAARRRAVTVGSPDEGQKHESETEPYNPEENPVEWIMITRSDPGGSVPRFMVERGTPGSICADAVKFLDWACAKDFDGEGELVEESEGIARKPSQTRRESFQSWRARSTVGIEEFESAREPSAEAKNAPQTASHGIWDTVTGAAATLKPYTPQAVLNHLPNATETQEPEALNPPPYENDNASTASFASAEDHLSSLSSSEDEGMSLDTPSSPASSMRTKDKDKDKENMSPHEKELLRLAERREALQKKFISLNAKLATAQADKVSKEETALQKAADKNSREMKKHEEKYKKELARIEAKQEKERKKMEQRKEKEAAKDVKLRLTRERDKALKELELKAKEAEELKNLVKDLQKENTALVMKLGRYGIPPGTDNGRNSPGSRSRTSSVSKASGGKDGGGDGGKKKGGTEGDDLAHSTATLGTTASVEASLESNLS